ncbi:MAG: GDSL-type esterase/lipase family protein [Bacteroidota bacterium]|nr:GDSL-type esterase/lipase family protein [Bacteroidota bacterium]
MKYEPLGEAKIVGMVFNYLKSFLNIYLLFSFITLISSCSKPGYEQVTFKEIVIPNLKSLSDSALKVNLLADNFGNTIPESDYKAFAQLYWKNASINISLTIQDDSITASDNAEIFLVDKRGGKNLVQFFISGLNTDTVNCTLWDFRGNRVLADIPVKYALTKQSESQKTILNFEMPLSYIGIRDILYSDMGIQLIVADIDNETSKFKQYISWSYANDTYRNSFATVPVKLGTQKSSDINETFKTYWDNDTSLIVKYITSKPVEKIVFKETSEGKDINAITTNETNKITTYQLLGAGNRKEVLKQLSISNGNKLLTTFDYVFVPKNLSNIKLKDKEEEIDKFKFLDSGKTIRPDILFVGHSFFRYWATIEDDFKGFNILNRAFGGSRVELILDYYNQVISPYQPKTIVLINGINDLNTGDTPEKTFMEFQTLVEKIHTDLPNTLLIILPHLGYKYASMPNLMKYDNLIINYAKTSGWIQLADIRNAFPQNPTLLKEALFPDYIHPNAKGYSYLAPIIKQQLNNSITH